LLHLTPVLVAMFCKGLTFMLICQSLGATLAKPTPRTEQISCKGKTCKGTWAVSMLQTETKHNRSTSVYLEGEHRSDVFESEKKHPSAKKDSSHSKFSRVEHWQEVMQYDLFPAGDLSSGELEVSKDQWMRAFDSLDKNGDGKLDGDDLDSASNDTANHHWNVSQEHYRLAVAQMAAKFPEFANFMIYHQPALVFFSETNTSVPLDAPVPDEESMALFAQRTQKLALLQEAEESQCQRAFGKFVYEAISLGISFADIHIKSYLGDEPAPEWKKQLDAVSQNPEIKDLMKQMGEEIQAGNWQGAAGHLWNLVVELYWTGALTSLIQEALSRMGWWEWAQASVNLLATVMAHIQSAGWNAIKQLVEKIRVEGRPLAPLARQAISECQ